MSQTAVFAGVLDLSAEFSRNVEYLYSECQGSLVVFREGDAGEFRVLDSWFHHRGFRGFGNSF